MELSDLFLYVTDLVEDKFPNANLKAHLTKLKHEADEVIENPEDIDEWADVLICFLAAISKSEHTLRDIFQAAENKAHRIQFLEFEELEDGTYQSTKVKKMDMPVVTDEMRLYALNQQYILMSTLDEMFPPNSIHKAAAFVRNKMDEILSEIEVIKVKEKLK